MTLTYLMDLFRSSKKDDEIYWQGYAHGLADSQSTESVTEEE